MKQWKKFIAIFLFFLCFHSKAYAQFSRPVIVLSGIVENSVTYSPVSITISVREVSDTAKELTQSKSNRLNGFYLVVLQPNCDYWVHIEGDSIISKDTLLSLPG